MTKSKIEWTEITWNPSTGCTKISAGCKNCYAERMAMRLYAMGNEKYRNKFKFSLHKEALKYPYTWKKPKIVFVNSMSDLFHESMPIDFLMEIFKVMNENIQHIFQILTKRPEQLIKYDCLLNWTENIWMGVTIEDFTQIHRLDLLKASQSNMKFLSLEPLLTALPHLDLSGIDWVIVGGESGPKSRRIEKEWVLSILNNCNEFNVPFFFKQWGGKNKKKTGRLLNGKLYEYMPKIDSKNVLLLTD
jgi:protein gp37